MTTSAQPEGKLARGAVVCVTVLLVVRWLFILDRYSVNVLFSDHWMIYGPLFEGDGLGSMFNLQHGPHRQGLGGLAIGLIAPLSAWNTRTDSLAVFIVLMVATALAFALKRKVTGRLERTDALIPLICLNVSQVEAIVLVPNLAHGVLPVLLLLLFCLSFFIESGERRTIAFCILAPLSIFTGFAMIAAPLLFVITAIDFWHGYRDLGERGTVLPFVQLIVLMLATALFMRGYQFPSEQLNPTVGSVVASASSLFARFGGIEWVRFGNSTFLLGLAGLLGLGVICGKRLATAVHGDDLAESKALFLLCGFSLMYSFATALGRSNLGIQMAQSSRYMTLLIPGLVGAYLFLRSWRHVYRGAFSVVFGLFILGGSLPLSWYADQAPMEIAERKSAWRDCYLAERDYALCTSRIGLEIMVDSTDPREREKLEYLERNKLSFFRDDARQER